MSVTSVPKEHSRALAVHQINPLADSRWAAFLERHPRSSVFHSSAWLEALRQTYGYEPVAYTTSPLGAALRNAIVFCRVNSWLTGLRLVSLPFSDHCEPLFDDEANLDRLLVTIERQLLTKKYRYVELRPIATAVPITNSVFRSTYSYCFHQLDLRPEIDTLFANCHVSRRRNIRRAEREGLHYEDGRSEALLDVFLELYSQTRRRHRAPPQPKSWFVNLISRFGDALKIRVANQDGRAVAAILTLRYKETITYKYGCSDEKSNHLAGMHFLMWRTIQEAKREGLKVLDLGRSDCSNEGLIRFKDRFGSTRYTLTYSRFAKSADSKDHYGQAIDSWRQCAAKAMVSKVPDVIFSWIGAALYRHFG